MSKKRLPEIIAISVLAWVLFITFTITYTLPPAKEALIQKALSGSVLIYSEEPASPAEAGEKDSSRGSLGTGFFIDENLIATNYHVVSEKNFNIIVKGHYSGEMYDARYLAGSPETDVAIIAIDDWQKYKNDVPYEILKFGNSNDVKPGDTVYAVGNPVGFEFTVTQGIVSSTDRYMSQPKSEHKLAFIQSDVNIHTGNSGGPLLNEYGEVIGINESVVSVPDGGNIPFSVQSNLAYKVIGNLLKTGKVEFPKIGIKLDDNGKHPVIQEVLEYSVGKRFDLKPLDTIAAIESKFGKKEVFSAEGLIIQINQLNKGDGIILDIYRDGELIKKELTL